MTLNRRHPSNPQDELVKNLGGLLLWTFWGDFFVHSQSREVLLESFTIGRLCSPVCPLRAPKQMLCFPIAQVQFYAKVKKSGCYVLCLRMNLEILGYQELNQICIGPCELHKGSTLDSQIVGCDQVNEYSCCFSSQPRFRVLIFLTKVAK